MSKQDLIEFMRKKGNERKKAFFDEMTFQTEDSEHTSAFFQSYHSVVQEKQAKLGEIYNKVDHFALVEAETSDSIAKAEAHKAALEKDIEPV